MATFSAAASDVGFNMFDVVSVDFSSNDFTGGTNYSYLTDGGDDVDLIGAGFTYAGGVPTGGTVTSGSIDLDNDDFLNPEIVFSGLSNSLVTMMSGGAPSNAIDFFDQMLNYSNDSVTGSALGDTLKGLGGDDTIDGGTGSDSIQGGAGDDYIIPGGDQDTSDGGSGTDTLDLSTTGVGAIVDLAAGTADFPGFYVETHTNYENLFATTGSDTVSGTSGANLIKGLGGNDSLLGGAGLDSLYGGDGNDTVRGGAGADLLFGDDGFGNVGVDAVSYQGSAAGVSVNLETGAVSGGDAAGDTISEFEGVFGSTHNDTLTGSDGVGNDLRGSVGNDSLTGLSGNDTLDGGTGNDTLIGGDNPDILVGGAGSDVISGGASVDKADYTKASAGVNASLASGGISGDAAGDTYSSIEILSGSNFGDTLTGGNSNDDLRGRGGSDLLSGGAANDKLNGGSGNDTLDGGAGNDTLFGGGHNDTFQFSGNFGADTISDMNEGADIRDVIRLIGQGAAFDTFTEVLAATTQVGLDAVINFGGGNTITLTGIDKSNLHSNDFLFG